MQINYRRQYIVFFIFGILFSLLLLRLFFIQVISYARFKSKADNQHKVLIELKPKRGSIFDTRERILAMDTRTNSVYAVPREMPQDKELIADMLSEILQLDKAFILERLNKDKAFVWIKRKVTDDEAVKIKLKNLKGVGLVRETDRSYPNEKLLCQVLGFTDMDNNGINGIELYCDKYLKGKYGSKSAIRDARRKLITSFEEYLPPMDGYNVVLSIDEVIQSIVEVEVDNIVKEYKPKGVMVIAMDPQTGQVLAMANYPNFNVNEYHQTKPEVYKNKCIHDVFEPGSVFKIVTLSAVLEEGGLSLEDKIFCENGEYKVSKRILHDYHGYGTLTFREVIENSSNIGTVKSAMKLGRDRYYPYIKKFGFGDKTSLDLPGEENGILRSKSTWTDSDMTTVPMGQGISCTAIQLAAAVSTIANSGILMKPYLIKRIMDNDGNTIKEFKPQMKWRVISNKTCQKVKEVLEGVILRGTGKKAKLEGYSAAGKTGTAQKVGENRRYAEGKFMASFVGFAPVRNPRVALVVCVDEPRGNHFGGVVSAPAFKNIMQKILRYLEVPEDEKK